MWKQINLKQRFERRKLSEKKTIKGLTKSVKKLLNINSCTYPYQLKRNITSQLDHMTIILQN